jgi:hypothetical protein
MEKKDKIAGGLADKKKPEDFDPKKLAQGIKVEMEHTKDRSIAQEIAMDHLTEDLNYYDKLKEVEKQQRVDMEPDGKREMDYGSEELNKLKDRWKRLKKALNSSEAILDIASQEFDDTSDLEDDQGGEENADEAVSQQEGDDQGRDQEQAPEMSEEERLAEIAQLLSEEGYSDAEIDHIIHGHHIPGPTLDDHKMVNEQAGGEQERQHADEEHALEREHKKRMNDVEYEKAKSEVADPTVEKDHRKRMLDLEYETTSKKKTQAELEAEHKKRMLDLEYEKARKEAEKEDPTEEMKHKQLEFELNMKRMEKELELEFKKKELELKLKLQEETARQKAEHQAKQAEEDAKVNAAIKKEQAKHKIADAKKPPKKEKTGE